MRDIRKIQEAFNDSVDLDKIMMPPARLHDSAEQSHHAVIAMPIQVGSDDKIEAVELFTIRSGLNEGFIGWPGGKVNGADIITSTPKGLRHKIESPNDDLDTRKHDLTKLIEQQRSLGGNGLLGITLESTARELEEESLYTVGGTERPFTPLVSTYVTWDKQNKHNEGFTHTGQQVHSFGVNASKLLGFQNPKPEVFSIGLFTPQNAIDRLVDKKAPRSNIVMAKLALLSFGDNSGMRTATIVYPKHSAMKKAPTISDATDWIPNEHGVLVPYPIDNEL